MKRLWLAVLFALLASAARADVVCVSNNMCCQSAGGVSSSSSTAWTGTNSFIDSKFSLLDNLDNTKVGMFQLSGLTTATTRTYTLQDQSGALALMNGNPSASETGYWEFGGGGGSVVNFGSGFSLGVRPTLYGGMATTFPGAVKQSFLYTDPSEANYWLVAESGDRNFDFALAAQTDPTICVMSHNQSASQRGCLTHDGTNFKLFTPNNPGVAFSGGLDLTLLGGGTGGYPGILFNNKLLYFSDVSGATEGTRLEIGVSGTLGTGAQMGTIRGATSNGAGGSRGGEMWLAGGRGAADAVPARVVLGADGIAVGGTSLARITAGATKVLTNNTVTALTNATVASNTVAAGNFTYAVEVFDGTDVQVDTGLCTYAVSNKAGTIANNVVLCSLTITGVRQNIATAGTLAVTWTITAANPAVISLNANSSLTPSAGYPRVTYELHNLTQQAVAIQ